MSKLQIAILIILALLTLAVFGGIFYLQTNPPAPVPTPTIANTRTPNLDATQTFVAHATVYTLPPTWTVAPFVPTLTATRSPRTPTVTPSKLATIDLPAGAVLLNGTGDANSYVFALPEGTVTVNWTYYGASGEGSGVEYAYAIYQNTLEYEKNSLQSITDYYNRLIESAVGRGDARAYAQYQGFINGWIERYNRNVASAKAKYEAELAAHTSPFKVTLYRGSSVVRTLINVRGVYEGSFKQKTTKATDYYLVVETPGQWSIRILP